MKTPDGRQRRLPRPHLAGRLFVVGTTIWSAKITFMAARSTVCVAVSFGGSPVCDVG
jgi:hypothetical protein